MATAPPAPPPPSGGGAPAAAAAPAPSGAASPGAPAAPGPARGVGGGVSNLGGVSATNDLLRTARMNMGALAFNQGTVAGRDVNLHYHADQQTRPAASPVKPDEVDAVRSAFVAPAGFAELVSALSGQHVAILRAVPRAGADTSAMRLLLELGAGPLHRLDPRRALAELSKEELTERGGYLLSGLTDAAALALRGYDLDRISELLRPLDGRLVVVVPTGATIADPGAATYIHQLGTPPAPAEILTAHLRWRMRSAKAADQTLAQPDVAAALAAIYEREPSSRDMADLARLVHESHSASGTVDIEWVTKRMRERAAEDFDAWFDRLDDLPLRCLAISLALLNGLPFEVVTNAATRLRRRLEEPLFGRTSDPDIRLVNPVPERPDPFRDTRAARLRRLRAQITHTTLPAWFGDTPAQVMSYLNPEYAPAVINRVWDEYDDVRPILVEWLKDLGGHRSEPIRAWVATTVGVLATRAFEYVLNEIIYHWAHSGTQSYREAAAVALGVPASVGGLREQVQSVVRDWSRPESADELRATAARAYGAPLGQTGPEQALAALEYLSDSEDNATANSIGRSLAELMDWDIELAIPVLSAIVHWLGSPHTPERVTNAHIAFLRLAIDLTHEGERVGDDDDAVRWPTLLYLADTQPRLGPTIAGLWHAALNGPIFEDAKWAFSSWAVTTEPDLRSCTALGRLAAEVCRDERTRKILLQVAADWTTGKNPEPTPRAAASVISAVSDRSTPS